MAYKKIKGLTGLVYQPQQAAGKKHNCKDCFFCQHCSDDRCRSCLNRKAENRSRARAKPKK